MGLSKKRKQHLRHITSLSLETRKNRKVNRENQRKEEILRRQRGEEDIWYEFENPSSDYSSDESNCDRSSQDEPSSEEEDLGVENNRGDSTCEGLGDTDGGVQLEGEERTFKPTWRQDAGGYLRRVRGCGSSATEKRERRRKRELEKSASQTRSVVGMFSAQLNKSTSDNAIPMPGSLSTSFAPENSYTSGVKEGETTIESQT